MPTINAEQNESESICVDDIVFIYEKFISNTGVTTTHISKTPVCTNRSHEPRLYGWCGETNNISYTGIGIGKVKKYYSSGRMKVYACAKGTPEEQLALDDVGYSELGWS